MHKFSKDKGKGLQGTTVGPMPNKAIQVVKGNITRIIKLMAVECIKAEHPRNKATIIIAMSITNK